MMHLTRYRYEYDGQMLVVFEAKSRRQADKKAKELIIKDKREFDKKLFEFLGKDIITNKDEI